MARRKSQENTKSTAPAPATVAATEPTAPPPKRMSTAEAFERLCHRANRGDRVAQTALVHYLDAHPQLWERFGDLARIAETNLIDFIAEGQWLANVTVRRQATKLRQSLAGPTPTPLELIAVERIVAAWLQLKLAETQCFRPHKDLVASSYWAKRLEGANRIYDAAVRSLALVRLLLPAAQPDVPAGTDASQLTPSGNGHKRAVGANHKQETLAAGLVGEGAAANGFPVNRVAGLVPPTGDQESGCPYQDSAADKPHVNGHRNRLAGLLNVGSK